MNYSLYFLFPKLVRQVLNAVMQLMLIFQTRCKSLQTNAEVFRKEIDRFLDRILLTNSLLIYAPSQVALAAIIHGAGCNNENVDSYVTDILFKGDMSDVKLKSLIGAVRSNQTHLKL